MNTYALSVIVGLLGLVCIALAVLNVALRKAHKTLYTAWRADMRLRNDELHKLVTSVGESRKERDTALAELRRMDADIERHIEENTQLQAEKAGLHDALQDAQNEIKALHRQTVEMPSTSAKIPARPTPKPKGTPKKKEASI